MLTFQKRCARNFSTNFSVKAKQHREKFFARIFAGEITSIPSQPQANWKFSTAFFYQQKFLHPIHACFWPDFLIFYQYYSRCILLRTNYFCYVTWNLSVFSNGQTLFYALKSFSQQNTLTEIRRFFVRPLLRLRKAKIAWCTREMRNLVAEKITENSPQKIKST